MTRLPVVLAALIAIGAPLALGDIAQAQDRRDRSERRDQRENDSRPRGEDVRRRDREESRGAYPEIRGLRQGGYLPPAYENGRIDDYGRYRLRPPPRGYAWVRVGRGYALVSLETGQVFEMVPF